MLRFSSDENLRGLFDDIDQPVLSENDDRGATNEHVLSEEISVSDSPTLAQAASAIEKMYTELKPEQLFAPPIYTTAELIQSVRYHDIILFQKIVNVCSSDVLNGAIKTTESPHTQDFSCALTYTICHRPDTFYIDQLLGHAQINPNGSEQVGASLTPLAMILNSSHRGIVTMKKIFYSLYHHTQFNVNDPRYVELLSAITMSRTIDYIRNQDYSDFLAQRNSLLIELFNDDRVSFETEESILTVNNRYCLENHKYHPLLEALERNILARRAVQLDKLSALQSDCSSRLFYQSFPRDIMTYYVTPMVLKKERSRFCG